MWNDEEFVNELMNAEKLPKLIEDWKDERKLISILGMLIAALPFCLMAVGIIRFTMNSAGSLLLISAFVVPQALIALQKQDTKIKLAMLIQTLRERNELSAPSDDVVETSSSDAA